MSPAATAATVESIPQLATDYVHRPALNVASPAGLPWHERQQRIRAQGRLLTRNAKGLGAAALKVTVPLLARAIKHGDIAGLQVPQLQYAAMIQRQPKTVYAALRKIEQTGVGSYRRAFPGKYAEVTFHWDPDDLDCIPPDTDAHETVGPLAEACISAIVQICRTRHKGVGPALQFMLMFLTEAVTWGRRSMSISDSDLGVSADAGKHARALLRLSGFTITSGNGRTPSRYTLGTSLPSESTDGHPEDGNCTGQTGEQPAPHQTKPYLERDNRSVNGHVDDGTADAGIIIHIDEMVDHVISEYGIRPNPVIHGYCQQAIAAGVTHPEFNRITRQLDREQQRPERYGVGFVVKRLELTVERLQARHDPLYDLPVITPETPRQWAEAEFTRRFSAALHELDSDELDQLRVAAASRGYDPMFIDTRGLDDPLWRKYMAEVYAHSLGVEFHLWVTEHARLHEQLRTADQQTARVEPENSPM